ncbi:pirin family protein [Saxibacter everestensis]|uniref:Pirin family protein n=1 Tax=Saxibacter everestensis TaxID=2909229 RepID=A0ABY8QSJ7_9MICO|nr:pirin family protein [Brevibacteriaceae bacterium ZFBP1038]
MSNLEARPKPLLCAERLEAARPMAQVIEPRDVPLGGIRAMTVRRTLPTRDRSLIGAWCFLDHYGPDDVALTGGMKVPPHPHTGLQTVSWLFSGEVEHKDSAGHQAMVRPGELNLMTAGRGINHSEFSTPETTILHGVQLWTALPDAHRFTDPGFEHYVPKPVTGPGYELRVFLGSLAGDESPVRTFSPLLGAEVTVCAGSTAVFATNIDFEHGVLIDAGTAQVAGREVQPGQLAYLAPGMNRLEITAGDSASRLLLLGGKPLGESITMWWNFIGRSHDEIEHFRSAWQELLEEDAVSRHSRLDAVSRHSRPEGGSRHDDLVEPAAAVRRDPAPAQFGGLVGADALPAPELPNVTLKPRR